MDDLISRQAAIDTVENYWKAEVDAIPKDTGFETLAATCDLILKHNTSIYKALKALPSAQPDIIRCRDCKHYEPYDSGEAFYCPEGIDGCYPDDFCSHAERRTDE